MPYPYGVFYYYLGEPVVMTTIVCEGCPYEYSIIILEVTWK